MLLLAVLMTDGNGAGVRMLVVVSSGECPSKAQCLIVVSCA